MKNLIIILTTLFVCLAVDAQNVADSTIVIDRTETEPSPSGASDLSPNNHQQKKDAYENNTDTQKGHLEKVMHPMIMIDQSEKISIDRSEIDITPTPVSPKTVPIDHSLEDDPKKRLGTGPSQYDSRLELRQLNPLIDREKKMLDRAVSVGVVIEKSMMHKITDSLYQLDISTSIGKLYNLCPGEAFGEQPAVGIGTAFIIDDKVMLTAGHVFNGALSNYAIVFGFEMINKVGAYEALIPAKDIYFPEAVKYDSDELDVTMFSVDRAFNRPVLAWSPSMNAPLNTSVYMIGHPMGIPKKVALNASIQSSDNLFYFYTSLDAFQGNSGSPVFRMDTHEVIGILVSGEIDYKWNGNCNGFNICSIPFCKGEKVMRIEEVMNNVTQP